MALTLEARFRSAIQRYEQDPVAQGAIRGLQEVMLREGVANHSSWDGLHYTPEGNVEWVQVYLGDSEITVRKEGNVPKTLFDMLAQKGRIIFETDQQPAEG